MTTSRQRRSNSKSDAGSSGNKTVPDYKSELWRMADALRGSMDAAEYKHVVLGLIFLKYISDAFEEAHAKLEAERDEGADPEDPDEYRAQSIFWVPPEARWQYLKNPDPPAYHWPISGRRHDRHRARQSCAQRRAAQGLCPPCVGQDSPRASA